MATTKKAIIKAGGTTKAKVGSVTNALLNEIVITTDTQECYVGGLDGKLKPMKIVGIDLASTAEQLTGELYNGKPVYMKNIIVPSTPLAANSRIVQDTGFPSSTIAWIDVANSTYTYQGSNINVNNPSGVISVETAQQATLVLIIKNLTSAAIGGFSIGVVLKYLK